MAKRKASLRKRVWARAGGRCEYCHVPQRSEPAPFHIEHVIPKKHGGRTVMNNLAASCAGCNLRKASNIAGIDGRTGELTRLFNPRTDAWTEHFFWEGPVLIGRTAIGRTTVDVLGINHPERVRLRRLLIRLGVFPLEGDKS